MPNRIEICLITDVLMQKSREIWLRTQRRRVLCHLRRYFLGNRQIRKLVIKNPRKVQLIHKLATSSISVPFCYWIPNQSCA